MIKKVLNTIKQNELIKENDTIIAGVSGGPDSICMLDILLKIKNLKKINFEIIVAHINHQIREEADSDQKYVENYCKKNKIKYFSKRIDVKKYANNNKIGLEEAGRKIRYDFFEEVMKKNQANKIAIAHNKNDQIETMIMNILRGSGLSGLKGIEIKRNDKYIRPILECTREEIEQYCKENKLETRIDKTNFINDCTRNRIRNIVIPYIKNRFNPNIIETMSRLSEITTETEEYLKKETIKQFNEIKIEEKEKIVLNLKEFNKKEILIRKKIILYAIHETLGNLQDIEKVNIEDIIKMCEKNIGNKYLTPNKNIKVYVNKGKIFFESLK